MWHSYFSSFFRLFYPKLCEGCHQPLYEDEKILCLSCEANLSYTKFTSPFHNDTTLRLAGRFPFYTATSLAYFYPEGLLQQLLHALKYKYRKDIGYYLGNLLGIWLSDQDIHADYVIPVPIHPRKQRKRGYNQAYLLASGVSKILNLPIHNQALIRTKDTESQTKHNRELRNISVAQAFKVKDPISLANSHILLIDDVLTTGATLEACARALYTIPSIKISIATVGLVMPG